MALGRKRHQRRKRKVFGVSGARGDGGVSRFLILRTAAKWREVVKLGRSQRSEVLSGEVSLQNQPQKGLN